MCADNPSLGTFKEGLIHTHKRVRGCRVERIWVAWQNAAWCPQTTQCHRHTPAMQQLWLFHTIWFRAKIPNIVAILSLVQWVLIVITCICVIYGLNGSLSQIDDSVHLKRFQVLFIQSNVSQKGSWNRQAESGLTQSEASLSHFRSSRLHTVEAHRWEYTLFFIWLSSVYVSLQRNKIRAAGQQCVALVSRAVVSQFSYRKKRERHFTRHVNCIAFCNTGAETQLRC